MAPICRRAVLWLPVLLFFALKPAALPAATVVPSDVQEPGTQPGEAGNLESPDKCSNCHSGYARAVEPGFNWRGSMMANAGRDPIFWATVAVAEQAFDGSGDLCIRCHSTTGWNGGRSTPTDGSALTADDSSGVTCDTCHRMTNPDNTEHLGAMVEPFVANDGTEGYYGSGMISIWPGSDKLGPYDETAARHQFIPSNFHRSVDFCGSCHDVSNPVVGDLAPGNGTQLNADPVVADGTPGSEVGGKAAFNNPPYKYGVVERTFSEFKSSAFADLRVGDYSLLPEDLQRGALQSAYDAALAAGTGGDYEDGTPRFFSCQSCHMAPVTGVGCNKNGAPVRKDLPHHDMTGGNYWVGEMIKYQDSRGLLRLGGGLTGLQTDALDAAAIRARGQLSGAAALEVGGNALKVVNLTGHKLISGYPEGRRMWLNVRWYGGDGTLLREDGEYGPIGVTAEDPAGGPSVEVESLVNLEDPHTKIYEAHYGMTKEWADQLLGLGSGADLPLSYSRDTGLVDFTLGDLAALPAGSSHETFHFVLNNVVLKDNRIPPYGFDYEKARLRNALPEPADQYGYPSGTGTYDYYDELILSPPTGALSAEIRLMYQGTSWEYVQFLWKANDGANAFLGSEGVNLLEAWLNTGMASPAVMAGTMWYSSVPGTSAQASDGAFADRIAVSWSEVAGAEEYRVYRSDSSEGTYSLAAPVLAGTSSWEDSPLGCGEEWYYRVGVLIGTDEVLSLPDRGSTQDCPPTSLTVCAEGCDFTVVQEAIAASRDGDTVTVSAGTYSENLDFLGRAVTVQSESGPESTILDGGGSGSVVKFVSGEGRSSVLEGFTLTNGGGTSVDVSTGDDPGTCGGGIYSVQSSPTISDCVVHGNTAADRGGGLYLYTSSPLVLRTEIRGNEAAEGGGLYARISSPTFVNCVVSGNRAVSDGGGVYFDSSDGPSLTACTVAGNFSEGRGGGVRASYSSPLIVNSILWGNEALLGGAQLWQDGYVIADVDFSDVQGGYVSSQGIPLPGTGNVDGDPLFVLLPAASAAPTALGDFHLSGGSPCLDTGTDDGAAYLTLPADDLDGDPRPLRGGTDMGCDEWEGPVAVVEASPPGPEPLTCGQVVGFDSAGSSAGRPDLNIAAWEWDFDYDGAVFDVDGTGETATHSYGRAGTYTAALRVTDDDVPSNTDIAIAEVSVGNVAPVLSGVSTDLVVDENGLASLSGAIEDACALDTFTLDVGWGDGSPVETFTYAAGTNAFSESHRYLDDDPSGTISDSYTVSLVLRDDALESDSAVTSVAVRNVPPSLAAVSVTSAVDENALAVLAGTITDPSGLDTFTLEVDWGDGSAVETFTYAAGTTAFSESHRYLDDDPSGTASDSYGVDVTLRDDDLGQAVATAAVTVQNVTPQLTGVSASFLGAGGGEAVLTGAIADPSGLDTFTLDVDWGDGSPVETFAYAAGTTAFSEYHLYLSSDPDGFLVGLTVTDDDTGTDFATVTVVTIEYFPWEIFIPAMIEHSVP
jgi:parallel beta-helix repeat protein